MDIYTKQTSEHHINKRKGVILNLSLQISIKNASKCTMWGHHGHGRMVVGFIT